MDGGFIVLVDLCKGIIKDTNLLGSLILGEIYMAVMSRVDTPPEKRRRVTVYVDELPNFVRDSSFVENALSEARKYGLSLLCAAQHLHQLDGDLVASLLANATTHVVFRTNAGDGMIMATELSPMGRTRYLERLLSLEPRTAYALIRGEMPPVLMRTLEVTADYDAALIESVRQASTQQFGQSRLEVEQEIEQRGRQLDRLVASARQRAAAGGGSASASGEAGRPSTTTSQRVATPSAAHPDNGNRPRTNGGEVPDDEVTTINPDGGSYEHNTSSEPNRGDGKGDRPTLQLVGGCVRSDGEPGEFKPKRPTTEAP